MKVEHKYIKYTPQTSSDGGNIPVLMEIQIAVSNVEVSQIFDRKLLNSLCACSVKIRL